MFKKEDGQAIVEFALVIPIFLLLFFGIVEFGWTSYQKTVFMQGYSRASYDATAKALNDKDPLEFYDTQVENPDPDFTFGYQVYEGLFIENLIKDSIIESSLWGFKDQNLKVTNGRAVLHNKETTFDVPGIKDGTSTRARKITRTMELTGDLTYTVYPISGLGRFFYGEEIVFKKHLDCDRVIATQERRE